MAAARQTYKQEKKRNIAMAHQNTPETFSAAEKFTYVGIHIHTMFIATNPL